MPTLVLSPRFTPDSITLSRAALSSGWSVERLQRWTPPEKLKELDPVIYGEPLFAAAVAEALNLVVVEPPFDWLTRLSQRFVLRDISLTTLGEARKLNKPAFVKPADDKSFTACVYELGVEVSDLLPDSLPVLISGPVLWQSEFRCFVREGNIATISPYSRFGELAQAPDGTWPATSDELAKARRFTEELIHEHGQDIPPAVVIDIGLIAEKGWAVVEANPAFSAGIYGCDPVKVLGVIQRACLPAQEVSTYEARWIIRRGE